MKKFLLSLINFYQIFISPLIKQMLGIRAFCRYPLSCSQYAKEMINKKGAFKGSVLALRRVISCQPLFKDSGQAKMTKVSV